MADVLTVSLTGPLADDVRAAAEARGMSPEDYVRARLSVAMDPDADDPDWDEGPEPESENVSADDAFDALEARIAAARAAAGK
jgi:hypothetical protein